MDNFFQGCPAKMSDGRFLTDFRPADTREQYNKAINNIVRDDEYRIFLQQNGEKIQDAEWQQFKTKEACPTKRCIHTNPTRSTFGMSYNEMKLYNQVQTGKIKESDPNYPKCVVLPDYRLTQTNGVSY